MLMLMGYIQQYWYMTMINWFKKEKEEKVAIKLDHPRTFREWVYDHANEAVRVYVYIRQEKGTYKEVLNDDVKDISYSNVLKYGNTSIIFEFCEEYSGRLMYHILLNEP